MENYLEATDIIDWHHPAVLRRAQEIAADVAEPIEVARRCFEWVRDEVRHSYDYQLNPVTCAASEVLLAGTGYCYAKSHLLGALLRANGIPAGFCYQRLRSEATGGHCLHGLNAVFLREFGWYRIDARGNKEGVAARFTPPHESIAYTIRHEGEADLPEIWSVPLPLVIAVLQSCRTYEEVAARLPDVPVTRGPGGNMTGGWER